MSPQKHISNGDVSSGLEQRINALERRLAMIDGNGTDREGGRLGRLESTTNKVLWLAASTLVAVLANILVKLIK